MEIDRPSPFAPRTTADAPPVTRVILEQGGAWSRWAARIAWTIAGVSLVAALVSAGASAQYFQSDAKVVEKYHSLAKLAPAKVAIVEVAGAIMGGDGFARWQLDRIEADESVKAIVVRVDSPGGTVSGSDEIHYRLAALAAKRDLPVVVSMGGI
ncbi:MAG: signal peptide peptidase SppA, partial [Planctomycetia bacterium]|nr:signal peptide peptidase SppA [Planctomycetia bacterium]